MYCLGNFNSRTDAYYHKPQTRLFPLPAFFNTCINSLLTCLENADPGCMFSAVTKNNKLETVKILCPAFADTVIVLSESKQNIQNLLTICEKVAKEDCLKFSLEKVPMNGQQFIDAHQQPSLHLQDRTLSSCVSYKYLGVTLSNTTNYLDTRKRELVTKSSRRNSTCGTLRGIRITPPYKLDPLENRGCPRTYIHKWWHDLWPQKDESTR